MSPNEILEELRKRGAAAKGERYIPPEEREANENAKALEDLVAAFMGSPEERLAFLTEELEVANTIVVLQKRAMVNALTTGKFVAFTGDLEIPDAPERVEFFLDTDEEGEPYINMRDADGQ
jgi:hypothetical protein